MTRSSAVLVCTDTCIISNDACDVSSAAVLLLVLKLEMMLVLQFLNLN